MFLEYHELARIGSVPNIFGPNNYLQIEHGTFGFAKVGVCTLLLFNEKLKAENLERALRESSPFNSFVLRLPSRR